jgi:hypothetical protein
VAGVLILAVSATAAFGSISGYSKAKDGLKTLLLETDNLTASGTATVKLDGEEVFAWQLDGAKDGNNQSTHLTSYVNGEVASENFDTTLDGVETWFSSNSQWYYQQNVSGYETTNLLGYDEDDEFSNRLVNFMEIAADTLVGDLKNNVVQVGSENGSDLYEISISQSQVPSLVNAGLSLLAYSATGGSESYDVLYENASQTQINYYETTTGKTLSQEVIDYVLDLSYEYSDAIEEELNDFYETLYGEETSWDDNYYNILDEKGGGILYVKADGTYTYYENAQAFTDSDQFTAALAADQYTTDLLEYYVSQDLSLTNVTASFGVDKEGRLTSGSLTATFDAIDAGGSHHTLEIVANGTITDYTTTVVQPLDTGDLEKSPN